MGKTSETGHAPEAVPAAPRRAFGRALTSFTLTFASGVALFSAVVFVATTGVPDDRASPSSDSLSARGVEAGADISATPGADIRVAITALDEPAMREIERLAVERIGYIPRGGLLAGDADAAPSRTLRIDPADVTILSPVEIEFPDGVIRLSGIHAVGASDTCQGAFETGFNCLEWSVEGMRVLVDHASALRCLLAEMPEDSGRTGMCQANIGGDWIDLADWSVRNGITIATPDGPLTVAQNEARVAGYGIWAASWRPEGAPRIDFMPSRSIDLDLRDDTDPL